MIKFLITLLIILVTACSSSNTIRSVESGSVLDKSITIFRSTSGATVVALVNYDYKNRTQTVDYINPENSEEAKEANIYLAKTQPIIQDVYTAHLQKTCFGRFPITFKPYELRMNYRVSAAFYEEDDPRPKGYTVAWFANILTQEEIESVCKRLTSINVRLDK